MKRPWILHVITYALAVGTSAVMVKKCPPVPAPATPLAPSAPKVEAKAEVVPAAAPAPAPAVNSPITDASKKDAAP